MSHAVVDSVRTDQTSRPGYRISGQLYSAGDAPADAVRLAEIERALRRHLRFVPRRPAAPVIAPAPVPASASVAVAMPDETVDDPLVINAPDFVN